MAFALDSSQSVGTRNFELVKDFISEVVERFAIGPQETRVAVVTYSDTAVVNFGFQNFMSREEVLDAVQSLTYGTYYMATIIAQYIWWVHGEVSMDLR